MCKTLNISTNSFYTYKRKGYQVKILKSTVLRALIKDIYVEFRSVYGAPKIQKELEKLGYRYSVSYISRLMKEMGIRSKIRRKFVPTTDSKHGNVIAENHLNRAFNPKELGKVWVSDITYIKVGNHWNYLTTMIDLADRQVLGWSVSTTMTTEETVLKAWNHARRNRDIKPGFILHSDRGVQYTSSIFTSVFKENKFAKQSMSRKGNCWDNAVAESFFKTIKVEMCYRMTFTSKKQLEIEIFKYMNWYNNHRIHSTLDYLTPAQMQKKLAKTKIIKSA